MVIPEQYSIFDRQTDIQRFNEVVNDGWRSQLPQAENNGYVPVVAANSVDMADAVDIANTPYNDLPAHHKYRLSATTARLTGFLMNLYTNRRPLDSQAVEQGKELVYRGWVHGTFGNPTSFYVDKEGSEDAQKLAIVRNRCSRYDELRYAQKREVAEAILCMGALAFTRPDIFRWVDERSYGYDMRLIPGIQAHALKGKGHLEDVVKATGKPTPLQEMLLTEPSRPAIEVDAVNPGNYFVSFTAKGTPREQLEPSLRAVIAGLEQSGREPYCTYYLGESDYQEFAPKDFVDFMANAFRRIKTARALVCLILSSDIGDGMHQELAYAKATGIPIVMANHASVKDHSLVRMADYAFSYETDNELWQTIHAMPLEIPLKSHTPNLSPSSEPEPIWQQYIQSK